MHPRSSVGANLLWKKAQKNALKNITSEVMNKIIPHSIPRWTFRVCMPQYVASRVTSRHQQTIVRIMMERANGVVRVRLILNQKAREYMIIIAPNEPVRGQGLMWTRW